MMRGVGVACLLALAPTVAAQDFKADGYCRDGQPHGAYELRAASGQLRAAGAFANGKRTGSFLFWSSGGARIALLPFDHDRLAGTLALWYLPAASERMGEGRPKLEATYVAGKLSGMKRSWYPDGRMRAAFLYEAGALLEARAFSPTGAPLSPVQAKALAARDAVDDDAYFATLEDFVRNHPPRCDNSSERDEKAPPRGG
jgi:antitoxin component YwqK of YwqJK toxin-antitoxin module